MKKITKKEINERIRNIMLRKSHENEKIIYKEIMNNDLYEESLHVIAVFKTIDNLGFITVYNIFSWRNNLGQLTTLMYSTSINYDSNISI